MDAVVRAFQLIRAAGICSLVEYIDQPAQRGLHGCIRLVTHRAQVIRYGLQQFARRSKRIGERDDQLFALVQR